MEAHLATLDATLASIASLQRHIFTAPRPQPFTNAILAPIDPTLVPQPNPPTDFIRESDAFERNFFHFPATGAIIGDDEGIAHFHDNARQASEAATRADPSLDTAPAASELLPRVPQIRSVSVPTPLRPSTASAQASVPPQTRSRQMASQYDARTFLLAAQKLNENYQQAPRARRHIRQLLKRNAELVAGTSAQSAQAARLEQMLARVANTQNSADLIDEIVSLIDGTVSSSSGCGGGRRSGGDELEEDVRRRRLRLKALHEGITETRRELNREQMEVLALEEMRDEILQRREALRHQQRPPSDLMPGPHQPSSKAVPKLVAAARGVQMSRARTSSTNIDAKVACLALRPSQESIKQRFASTARPKPSVAAPPTSTPRGLARGHQTPTRIAVSGASSAVLQRRQTTPTGATAAAAADSTTAEPSSDEADQTLKPGAESNTFKYEGDENGDPDPSDELERLCEKIWDYFGDHLRHFSPGSEAADGTTTLALLRRILYTSSSGAESELGHGLEEGSLTSTSSSSSMAAASLPPTLTARVTALILIMLLRSQDSTQGSHSVDFPLLKSRVKHWCDEVAWSVNCKALEESDGSDGEAFATKAVYAMVAKRLLKIRRTGGKARVEFS